MPRDKKKRKNRLGEERSQKADGKADPFATGANATLVTREKSDLVTDLSGAEHVEEEVLASTEEPLGGSRWQNQAYFGKATEEQIGYIKRMEAILRNDDGETFLDDPEALDETQQLLVENFFKEIQDAELVLAGDFDGSRILEAVLHLTSGTILRIFFDRLTGHFMDLATHRFGSHVLQTLIEVSPRFMADAPEESELGLLPSVPQLLIRVILELAAAPLEVLYDPYANHIVRMLIQITQGKVQEDNLRSAKSKAYHSSASLSEKAPWQRLNEQEATFSCPEEVKAALDEHFIPPLLSASPPRLRDAALNDVCSPIFSLLMAEHPSLGASLLGQDLADAPNERWMALERLLTSKVASHLMQQVLQQLDKETADHLWPMLAPHFASLAHHPIANYPLQKYVGRTSATLFLQLLKAFPIDASTPPGMLQALSEAAVQHNTGFSEITKGLWASLGCGTKPTDPIEGLFPSLLSGVHCDDSTSMVVTVPGCITALRVLAFPVPFSRPIIASLSKVSAEKLLEVVMHFMGSRVVEMVVKSRNTTSHHLNALLQHLTAHAPTMACHSGASHVLEGLFFASPYPGKEALATKLSSHLSKLHASPYGRKVYSKLKLDVFVSKRKEWKDKVDKKFQPAISANGSPDMSWLLQPRHGAPAAPKEEVATPKAEEVTKKRKKERDPDAKKKRKQQKI